MLHPDRIERLNISLCVERCIQREHLGSQAKRRQKTVATKQSNFPPTF